MGAVPVGESEHCEVGRGGEAGKVEAEDGYRAAKVGGGEDGREVGEV